MNADHDFIPVAQPDLSGREEEYVLSAIRSSWISSQGPFIDRFEREFAALCGTRTAIGVSNGTVALHLALLTLGAGPGDEVIVPSLTFIATANAVRYVGAEPIFVDVDETTWCLDPEKVASCITQRTKGIIAVHLYGHPADMDAINRIASAHGLWVVEDAAEAPMATYKGRPAGSLSPMATFSFYGNKIFTSGEGGAITLSDPELERSARLLRGQGMDPKRRYYFPITGYNFRLTNVACAFLCAQLERRVEIIDHRRKIYNWYQKMLAGIPGIGFQPVAEWATLSPWLFSILIDRSTFGMSRDELAANLARESIDTRPFFIPLHGLPPFQKASDDRGAELVITERLAEQGLSLPTYNQMTEANVRKVSDSIRLIQRHGKRAS